jgi:hypothetical protein
MVDLAAAQKQSYWRYNVSLTTIPLVVLSYLSSINSLFSSTNTISQAKEEQR